MSAESLTDLVERLTEIEAPDLDAFEGALGAQPQPTNENPKWNMYELAPDHAQLERADLRIRKSGNEALLSLWAVDQDPPSESDLDLGRWAQPVSIDINPRIPPEGTVAFVFLVNDVRVAVQLTHTSRKLRSIALEWSAD